MRFRVIVIAIMLSAGSLAASAQMGMSAPAATPGSAVSPAKALDELLSLYESEVVPAAKAMPADKYDFAPGAATFAPGSPEKFDTVRTFGQQVTHVAEANYYFYMSLSGLKPDVDMKALDALTKSKTTNKEEAVRMLISSLAFAHKAIATITSENAYLAIKPIDGMDTRASLAAFGVAHGYDHYGQMVEYLRMNGIVPPASAK
jgi:uncharacterized damage-inducible protein DinB